MKSALLAGPAFAAAAFLSGCNFTAERSGPTQYDTRPFERGSAEELHLNLTMGAGDLRVGSGTQKLAQTYFTYNVPGWKPEIQFSGGKSANLTIRQPGGSSSLNGRKYEWDIRLANDVPLYLRAEFGAGEAQLDLGGLSLRDVQVDMGVGKLEMDLRGAPTHDYNVHISGGVGEAVVHLPSTVGVYAEASGGIGSIDVRHLNKVGDHWENDAYAKAAVRVHVKAEGGIGSIRLLGE